MMLEVNLAPIEKRYVFANMWIAYAHEISQYQNDLPSIHGMMGDTDDHYKPETVMAEWWEHPGKAFPYLITVDNRPAGFALVASPPLVDGDADKELVEFFLFHLYRNKGIGKRAALQVFDKHRGSWQLSVLNKHSSALGFWKNVLTSYAKDLKQSPKTLDGMKLTEFVLETPQSSYS
ncbi:MAG: hypothetical protein AAFY57_02105 [Cyanobacteria bacterium J06642_2]